MITVYLKDAANLAEVEEGSCALAIDHHPHSDEDLEYKQLARRIYPHIYTKLMPDAFFVTIQHDRKNLGAPPRHIILYQAAIAAGFQPHEQKIWHRRESISLFRKSYAQIQIFTKGSPKRFMEGELKEYLNDVWLLPDSMKRDDYTDAFTDEIPARLIKVLTRQRDTVLDPFLGSGTTLKQAELLGRNGIGYEIRPELRKFYPGTWSIL